MCSPARLLSYIQGRQPPLRSGECGVSRSETRLPAQKEDTLWCLALCLLISRKGKLDVQVASGCPPSLRQSLLGASRGCVRKKVLSFDLILNLVIGNTNFVFLFPWCSGWEDLGQEGADLEDILPDFCLE